MTARYSAVVSAILVLAGGLSAGSAGGDKKDDKDKLQGEWVVVSMEGPQKRFEVKDSEKRWSRITSGRGPAPASSSSRSRSTQPRARNNSISCPTTMER